MKSEALQAFMEHVYDMLLQTRERHYLDRHVFACDLGTIHGRMAARAYAYSIAPTDTRGAERILDIVGREG